MDRLSPWLLRYERVTTVFSAALLFVLGIAGAFLSALLGRWTGVAVGLAFCLGAVALWFSVRADLQRRARRMNVE